MPMKLWLSRRASSCASTNTLRARSVKRSNTLTASPFVPLASRPSVPVALVEHAATRRDAAPGRKTLSGGFSCAPATRRLSHFHSRDLTFGAVNPTEALGLPRLQEGLRRLEPLLTASVVTGDGFLDEVTTHLIAAGGKRLRPLLALATATAGERDATDDDLMGAVAVELVHLASLYHDDVIDEATIRRNVESVNSRFGNLVAIVAGDYLLARSAAIAASLGDRDRRAARRHPRAPLPGPGDRGPLRLPDRPQPRGLLRVHQRQDGGADRDVVPHRRADRRPARHRGRRVHRVRALLRHGVPDPRRHPRHHRHRRPAAEAGGAGPGRGHLHAARTDRAGRPRRRAGPARAARAAAGPARTRQGARHRDVVPRDRRLGRRGASTTSRTRRRPPPGSPGPICGRGSPGWRPSFSATCRTSRRPSRWSPAEPVEPVVPHLASILASRAFSFVSRACTLVMRLAMQSATLVWPAAFALASRAWALGRRALTLASSPGRGPRPWRTWRTRPPTASGPPGVLVVAAPGDAGHAEGQRPGDCGSCDDLAKHGVLLGLRCAPLRPCRHLDGTAHSEAQM